MRAWQKPPKAAWAEAGSEARAEHDQTVGTEDRSLVRTPTDEVLAWLGDTMAQAQIAADSERDLDAQGADSAMLESDDLDQDEADVETPTSAADITADLEHTRAALQALRGNDQEVLDELQHLSSMSVEANGKRRFGQPAGQSGPRPVVERRRG